MKHLVIKNIGTIKDVDIELKKINVIIGPQALGKSTILKIASFCSWVEKRIELSQDPNIFKREDYFKSGLIKFHKMDGYFKKGALIKYSSNYMSFSYNYDEDEFLFRWKKRWLYKRSKISYIPSERNIVAAIPNWFEVSMERNNIRSFMTDWEFARKSETNDRQILNLNLSYHYDKETRKDQISVGNNEYIDFTNTSSGLQSLVPMYIFLNYLYSLTHTDNKINNLADEWTGNDLLNIIYKELFKKKNKADLDNSIWQDQVTGNIHIIEMPFIVRTASNMVYKFGSQEYKDEFLDVCNNYLQTNHCDIYLEEPENNLFPTTQADVVDWLLEKTKSNDSNTLMIATHSPYILTSFLSKKEEIGMFVAYPLDDRHSTIKSLNAEDQSYIYDYGIDAFFNLENLIEE